MVKMSEWISVKDRLPPCDSNMQHSFCLALHSIHGVGVAWFWNFRENHDDTWPVDELEEDFKDKYICSCDFIINKIDGNHCIDTEEDINIFEHSPHFRNLGSVTHWMPLPDPPN